MRLANLKNKSRIILALDHLGKLRDERILRKAIANVAGVKIGLPLVLSEGFSYVVNFLSNKDTYVLADFKLADIPDIMIRVSEKVIGFVDGVIAHAFVGCEAISKLREFLKSYGVELFLVIAMTHRGAEEFINRHTEEFIEIAKDYADGVVAPATFPDKISLARRILEDKVIVSPGIGAQGAEVGSAIRMGADFEIIGRLITMSEDPLAVVSGINRIHRKILASSTNSHRCPENMR